MATTNNNTTKVVAPIVTNDPRFIAGRKLVERGMANEGAVEIFATYWKIVPRNMVHHRSNLYPPIMNMVMLYCVHHYDEINKDVQEEEQDTG